MTFSQAFIYLLAAVISVPLAKRLGLGSVLGYLFAGVVIGPFCFGLVRDRRPGCDARRGVRRGHDALRDRARIAAGDPVAHARTDPRPGRRASPRDGGCGFRPCAPLARAVADRDRGRLHPGDVFDRDRAAVVEREKPDEDCRRQGVVCSPFVPGYRCSSDSRIVPAACDGNANRG